MPLLFLYYNIYAQIFLFNFIYFAQSQCNICYFNVYFEQYAQISDYFFDIYPIYPFQYTIETNSYI